MGSPPKTNDPLLPLVLSKAPKRISQSQCFLADVVGDESLRGKIMQPGSLLDMMDVVAGHVSFKHSESRVATLSFDRVDLSYPILHGDLVRCEGRLLLVGRSSMIIEVKCYRQDLASGEYLLLQRSFITMVAIHEDGTPKKDVPQLIYSNQEEVRARDEVIRRGHLTREWVELQKKIDASTWAESEVEDKDFNRNQNKRFFKTIKDTEITVSKQFLPRNQNMNNTIFGGDILLWMDKVALYTAMNFTKNRNLRTIAMNRIFFMKPAYSTDLVQMQSHVVYVRNFTLEVEIRVWLKRITGEVVPSHTGYFTVLNFDETYLRRPIITGLQLQDEDQDGLRAYQKAKARHYFWKQHDLVDLVDPLQHARSKL